MRLLLDTHIFIWLVSADPRLPAPLQQHLREHDLTLSVASIWEISIKYHLGKLPSVAPVIEDVEGVASQLGADILNISAAHALRAGALDWSHRDPFDRLLVAQAQVEGMPLVTLDEHIASYAGAPLFTGWG